MLCVKEILTFLAEQEIDVEVFGNKEVAVDSYCALNFLTAGRITWVKKWSDEWIEKIQSVDEIIVVGLPCKTLKLKEKSCLISCSDPKMCFFEILGHFFSEEKTCEIAKTAVIQTKILGSDCAIGHYSVIGPKVSIGDHVTIENNVTIEGRVSIGNHVTIHSGCVIGKFGHGYYKANDGHMKKVPHKGGVIIGDYVEIGANSCIDCGTMGDTVIEAYSKINNLCHIGHNASVGMDCFISAGCILCGSSKVGDRGYIAPGAVVKNQIKVGQDGFVGIQTAVIKDVEDAGSVFGIPGRAFKREYNI